MGKPAEPRRTPDWSTAELHMTNAQPQDLAALGGGDGDPLRRQHPVRIGAAPSPLEELYRQGRTDVLR
jgi:hypothetical protein